MSSLKIKHVEKIYDNGFKAIPDFNLEIEDKEFIIFVGPSGCGKTTMLRMIAGLETISGGELYIGDRLVNEVEPKDRDIAMVFQNYALYPHMTVYDNMAFSQKLKKFDKKLIDEKVHNAAKILEIEHLLDRKPGQLSGGQRQRVAMGRAIVRNPKVFLMDEPLSNLDAKLRAQMRVELKRLHRNLGATIIYVTHDQVEAMTLGTRIVVINHGEIMQVDTPKNLYDNPENLFVATFIGSPQMNIIRAKVVRNGEICELQFGDASISLPENKSKVLLNNLYEGKEIIFGIRPEDFILMEDQTNDIYNVKDVKVRIYENMGSEGFLYFKLGGERCVAKINKNVSYNVDDIVKFKINADNIHLFNAKSEKVIK